MISIGIDVHANQEIGEAFDPTAEASLEGLWEADSGVTTDGLGVTSWADQSTNGRNFSRFVIDVDLEAGTFGGGTLPAVQGDRLSARLGLAANISLTGSFSIWFVANFPGKYLYFAGADHFNLIYEPSGNHMYMRIGSGTSQTVTEDGDEGAGTGYVIDQDMVIEIHRDSSGDVTVLRDGVDISASPKINNSNTFTFRFLFAVLGAAEGSNGFIGALAIFSTENDATLKANMRSYLGRWVP